MPRRNARRSARSHPSRSGSVSGAPKSSSEASIVRDYGMTNDDSEVAVTLGALTILSARHYIINSLHVVTGASVLATSLVLTLRAHRARFARRGTAIEELGGFSEWNLVEDLHTSYELHARADSVGVWPYHDHGPDMNAGTAPVCTVSFSASGIGWALTVRPQTCPSAFRVRAKSHPRAVAGSCGIPSRQDRHRSPTHSAVWPGGRRKGPDPRTSRDTCRNARYGSRAASTSSHMRHA